MQTNGPRLVPPPGKKDQIEDKQVSNAFKVAANTPTVEAGRRPTDRYGAKNTVKILYRR